MKLLLSCISTQHSTLKKHWSQTRDEIACPLTTLGSLRKPEGDLGGLLCSVEDLGATRTTLNLSMAAGLAPSPQGLLVTTFSDIHEVDPQLQSLQSHVISSPLFNALHSISRTRHGYLVASTGLDLVIEFDYAGEVLWTWWATDHGFPRDQTGAVRELDKSADYRSAKFGTLQQATHVNSAAELPDGRILATLFHQGTVIAIDRETGDWSTVLEGLDHPHSVRILDEQHFTVADTVHGRALLVKLPASGTGIGEIEEEVDAETSWLQDCSYNAQHNVWVLVDGKQTRVSLRRGRFNGTSAQQNLAQFSFNPEWRLYEAYTL